MNKKTTIAIDELKRTLAIISAALAENKFINAQNINYPSKNVAVIMAGSPGSGKSTIIKERLLVDGKRINPDDLIDYYIMRLKQKLKSATDEEKEILLKPFDGKLPDKNNEKDVEQLYNIIVRDKEYSSIIRDNFINSQRHNSNNLQNIIIDTTSSDAKTLLYWINQLKEIGYYVMILYVVSKLKSALNRNKNRDRVVNDDYLMKTYKTINNMFPNMIQDGSLKMCDELWIIFNDDIENGEYISGEYGGTAFKMYKKDNGKFIIPSDILNKLMSLINDDTAKG